MFFLEEEEGAESKGGSVGRALNCLLTMWPELLSWRQQLDVVLSLLLVLVFALRGFSPATRSLSCPYIYLFIYSLTLFKVDISLRHLGVKLDAIPSLNVSQSQFSLNQIGKLMAIFLIRGQL